MRDTQQPNERLARFLREQFPREHATKRLAEVVDCTPKAAENMLAGHWPRATHMAAIVRRFGQDVLDAVFGPEIDATVAKLNAEVRHLEEQLEAKRAVARQMEGPGPRLAQAVARDEDRAARPGRRVGAHPSSTDEAAA